MPAKKSVKETEIKVQQSSNEEIIKRLSIIENKIGIEI